MFEENWRILGGFFYYKIKFKFLNVSQFSLRLVRLLNEYLRLFFSWPVVGYQFFLLLFFIFNFCYKKF